MEKQGQMANVDAHSCPFRFSFHFSFNSIVIFFTDLFMVCMIGFVTRGFNVTLHSF